MATEYNLALYKFLTEHEDGIHLINNARENVDAIGPWDPDVYYIAGFFGGKYPKRRRGATIATCHIIRAVIKGETSINY